MFVIILLHPFKKLFHCDQSLSRFHEAGVQSESVSHLPGNRGRQLAVPPPSCSFHSSRLRRLLRPPDLQDPVSEGRLVCPHYPLSPLRFSENARLFSFGWPLLTQIPQEATASKQTVGKRSYHFPQEQKLICGAKRLPFAVFLLRVQPGVCDPG